MEVVKDERLWKVAQKRVRFKGHLVSYLIVNGFLWILWYITAGRETGLNGGNIFSAWPIWSTLGWGVGLAFSYVGAYHNTGGTDEVQKEYDKLLNQKK